MAGTKGKSGGHNRKSIADLQLSGGYRPGRHGGRVDPPAARPTMVPKPTRLSTGAAAVWDELAPLATNLGTLTPSDVRAFSVLCELEATREAASAMKATAAALQRERATARAVLPWLEMFGLAGPASLARLHVTPPGAATNPLEKFLTRPRPVNKWQGALP